MGHVPHFGRDSVCEYTPDTKYWFMLASGDGVSRAGVFRHDEQGFENMAPFTLPESDRPIEVAIECSRTDTGISVGGLINGSRVSEMFDSNPPDPLPGFYSAALVFSNIFSDGEARFSIDNLRVTANGRTPEADTVRPGTDS